MENLQIRDFSEFCEQLNEIRIKFHKWDSCEKTVGLYYLMVGLPFANARFLQNALEQCINAVNTHEAQILERNANDTTYVSSFLLEAPQVALSLLLNHLPLLKPGNRETAECYLKTIRQVLMELIAPPVKIYNECVEILSYLYIHPAFTHDDKKSFKHLLKQMLNKVGPQNFIHSANESSDESISPNPDSQQNIKRLDRRSNSLTSSSHDNFTDQEGWFSQENLCQASLKPRSYSLSSEKSLLSATSNLQASRSETRLSELILTNNLPAMKSIISWLKSLRLHKYSWVFHNLTYSQVIKLKEETLQAIGITKGARHKLLLSISKLKDRSSMLTELETEVMNGSDLSMALKKLKGVLQSPLQLTLGEDLVPQLVKVMGKVCTQLLMLRQPSDDLLMTFTSLCERAETMDDFSEEQKKRLNMWKNQLIKNDSRPINYRDYNASNIKRAPMDSKYCVSKMSSGRSAYTKKSSSYPNMKNNPSLKAHRHSVGSVTLKSQLFAVPHNHHRPQNTQNCMRNFLEASNKQFAFEEQKIKDHNSSSPNTDIESRLESLCIQMMEHALGP